MSDSSRKIPHREQGGGQGSLAEPGAGTCRSRLLRAGPARCRFAVRAGPKTKTPRPQERRRRQRGTELVPRSEEHPSELQSLMRNSYAVFCFKKKIYNILTI